VLYNIIFAAWEFFNYYHSGRLPALAYPDGGLVRFGAALDDPNGFGTWSVLPILLMLAGWPSNGRKIWRGLIFAALLFLLVKTVSYTAFTAAIVGVTVFVLLTRNVGRAAFLVVGGAAGAFWLISSDAFNKIVHLKGASALGRFTLSASPAGLGTSIDQYFDNAGIGAWLIGNPAHAASSETYYLLAVEYFGLPVVLLTVGLLLATIRQGLLRTAELRRSSSPDAPIYAALTAFVIAFCIAAAGVPLFEVFPVNLTFWVVAMILWLPVPVPQERLIGFKIVANRGIDSSA
jgi:hypothetical protein